MVEVSHSRAIRMMELCARDTETMKNDIFASNVKRI